MNQKKILLDHGSGGLASQDLVAKLFVSSFDNPILAQLEDCAVLELPMTRFAFSTDSYVVDPIFFPGGDIGQLAVHGTINDLAVMGAKPLGLSMGLVIEEGFHLEDLDKIMKSVRDVCKDAGVPVVTGDTKVMEKGKLDKIIINTSGVGIADAVLDDDGNVVTPAKEEIVRMGVKEQQMMWMAIKALQEAQTRIEELEAKVAALEAN